MSNLISGKEALIALANGEEVEACVTTRLIESEWHWFNSKNLSVFEIESQETEGLPDGSEIRKIVFRLKTKTITLNNIEVPMPFEPKEGETYWFITDSECGYNWVENKQGCRVGIAAWRTEYEIKQVVAALRTIFKTDEFIRENMT